MSLNRLLRNSSSLPLKKGRAILPKGVSSSIRDCVVVVGSRNITATTEDRLGYYIPAILFYYYIPAIHVEIQHMYTIYAVNTYLIAQEIADEVEVRSARHHNIHHEDP